MSDFGFGFIEVGTLTPKPQDGNPQPRCFRLLKDEAIINRMGINNKGVKYAVSYIKRHHPNCVIGASITKGKDTPVEQAAKDYEICFEYLYDIVDYIALNVSCPNVKDLYKLQDVTNLSEIIDKLLELRRMYDDYRPILLKISPDIPYTQLDEIIDTILVSGLDGVIATNTTISRDGLKTDNKTLDAIGNGGLSGAPLFKKTLDFVSYIARKTGGSLPIIASGGIMSPQQAKQMLDAGASLVQVYSGFIYNGPGFVKKINKYLVKNIK
jgi:dihydroorotate dehydrogenase, subfamily 2